MKASQFFISTLKEAPAEAALASHKLMLRAGLIKANASGLYTWMPMGLRVLRKVEAVVREEMNRAGAIELLMPVIQPADLWKESGRWDFYGDELLRITDRHDNTFCFSPTCEELITDIVRKEITSYKQLPKNFYHIQTKFRDERRPRFGVMRAREFVMKDAYSFHADYESLVRDGYRPMYHAYCRVFDRLGLDYRPVAADTGSIGGTGSHEFQVLAESGEDVIAYSSESDFAANIELAPTLRQSGERAPAQAALVKVHTPGVKTIPELVEFLQIPIERTLKSIVVEGAEEGELVLLLLRGDHEFNDIKAEKLPGVKSPLAMASRLPRARICRHPQRDRRRPQPRRQRLPETRTRYRSRPRIPAARQIFRRPERLVLRQQRQIANHGNGLLRHRHHPHRGRRHRAEQRRTRHHLDQRHGAVPSRDRADELQKIRSRARGRR